MTAADRAFWLAVYRAVCAIAAAIKRRYLGRTPGATEIKDGG